MKLTDVRLRTLTTPGKHFDGGGLYLEVTAAGGRYWRMKYRFGGKEKRLAFGKYPEVGLKLARERREEARAAVARGEDPSLLKRQQKAKAAMEAVNTFRAVTDAWIQHQAEAWTEGTRVALLASFKTYVFPRLGDLPLAQIRPRDVVSTVKAIEATGAGDLALRTLQRVKAVFRYALVHELIDSNPMLDLRPAEILKPRTVRHRAALSDRELPGFLAAFESYEGDPTTKNALEFLMLTAARPGEVRGARWCEIDEAAATWHIPAERMKMRSPHVIPLSKQALAVLKGQRAISGKRDLVFPSPYYPGQQLSENTLNGALTRMGFKGAHSAHGFRSLFSTVANEAGHDADAIERQLAHIERNKIRAAYHRAAYLADRVALMQWWADHIDRRRAGKVLKFTRKVAA